VEAQARGIVGNLLTRMPGDVRANMIRILGMAARMALQPAVPGDEIRERHFQFVR